MQFNLADLFECVADAVPDREALVCGVRRLTYRQLDERATRLAHVLAARGVGTGDHVGLWLHNGVEYVEGLLAAFKLRAVPINISYRYVADELRHLFVDSDCCAVIHDADLAPRLAEISGDLPLLTVTVAVDDAYEAALAAASPDRDFESRSADDLYILYTGGTTGDPKGVMWRHEDLFFAALQGGNPGGPPIERPQLAAERALDGATVRVLAACPLIHGTAQWMALWTLLAGGSLVVCPDRHFDADELIDVLGAERVSFLVIVGDAFARPLADALEHADEHRRARLSSLTAVLSGGAVLSPSVKDALLRLLPSAIVIDGYGATETGGQGQTIVVAGHTAGPPRFRADEHTAVLDDHGRPVLPGSGRIGHVARRGHIPLGYYKDEARTATTFPVIDGVRWAIPGDLGTVAADGRVVVFGRGSVSINTGGEKVFPEEVEATLKSHPAVFDAVVVGVADERWGEQVAAVVMPRHGRRPTVDELTEHCRAHLAGYKVPRVVVLVDHLVRAASGKPDYRWARATVRGPVDRSDRG